MKTQTKVNSRWNRLNKSRQVTQEIFDRTVAELANNLNFKLSYHKSQNLNEVRKSDLMISLREFNYFYIYLFMFIDLTLAVPVGQEFNGYEKFLLPFDSHVLILILLTFFAALFIGFHCEVNGYENKKFYHRQGCLNTVFEHGLK